MNSKCYHIKNVFKAFVFILINLIDLRIAMRGVYIAQACVCIPREKRKRQNVVKIILTIKMILRLKIINSYVFKCFLH